MQRRQLLKMASAFGAVIPSWAFIPVANAQAAPYTGRILINVHASGGIDQSSWTDPRETDPTINNYANVRPAGVAGNIRYAPMGGPNNDTNKAFFDKYFRQMLVINGVHSDTNGHDEGTRAHATGKLDLGYPNIAELFASNNGSGMPMAWLNAGGYNVSAGMVVPTAVPDATTWRAMGQPNAATTTNDLMKASDLARVKAARIERMKAMQARGDVLPRSQLVAQEFLGANNSQVMLDRVAQFTPATFDAGFTTAHIAMIAAQAGITSTIQLSSGGFDGHSNIDNAYATALPRLTTLVDYLWQKAAALGLSDRIFLRIYSEFGRTALNAGNGKDHWAVGSQILMEANPAWGNRVFGASGPRHEQQKISMVKGSGALDPVNGMVIRPRHIHAAMRSYLGIQTSNPKFDLKIPVGESFDFFNPAASTGYPNL